MKGLPTGRAWLCLNGFEGRSETEVRVVAETRTKWVVLVVGDKPLKLAGRARFVEPSGRAMVPKGAVRFGEPRS